MNEFPTTSHFADSGSPRKGHGSARVRRRQPLGTGAGVLGVKRREQETIRTSLRLSPGWPMRARPPRWLSRFCSRLPRGPSGPTPCRPSLQHPLSLHAGLTGQPLTKRIPTCPLSPTASGSKAWPETPSLLLPSRLPVRGQAFHRRLDTSLQGREGGSGIPGTVAAPLGPAS